ACRIDTEQQLEVFAVREGVPDSVRWRQISGDIVMDRDGFRLQRGTDAAGGQHMLDVRRQSVTEVDHGVQVDGTVQDLRLANSRSEAEVAPSKASPQCSG